MQVSFENGPYPCKCCGQPTNFGFQPSNLNVFPWCNHHLLPNKDQIYMHSNPRESLSVARHAESPPEPVESSPRVTGDDLRNQLFDGIFN